MSRKKSSIVPLSVALKPPTCAKDLRERIVHYGGFYEGLEFMIGVLKQESSSTVIIRGDVGVGKRSLLKTAFSLDLSEPKVKVTKRSSSTAKPLALSKPQSKQVVYLNPYMFPDDYSALRHLASSLKIKSQGSIQAIVEAIEERSRRTKEKLIIVLEHFEDFCRQKQSLLYNLTNLSQHGENVTIIGWTISLDCTKNLEKRVRSRLMSSFYHLNPPYSTKDEYLEFASYLLGNHEISGRLAERLTYMYYTGSLSIRTLKRFLMTCCSWDDEGNLTVDHPVEVAIDPASDVVRLQERLKSLTRPQLELLKMAVFYTYDSESSDFNLQTLEEVARKHHYTTFETTSPLAYKNTAMLVKLGLFKQCKANQTITQHTIFCVGVLSNQFRHAMEQNPELHCFKTDALWKKLR